MTPAPTATGRLSRSVARQIESAGYSGLRAAAKIHGAAYATHVALTQVGMLSAEECRLLQSVPVADPLHQERVAARLRVLVENFTGVAAAEIADLGF